MASYLDVWVKLSSLQISDKMSVKNMTKLS